MRVSSANRFRPPLTASNRCAPARSYLPTAFPTGGNRCCTAVATTLENSPLPPSPSSGNLPPYQIATLQSTHNFPPAVSLSCSLCPEKCEPRGPGAPTRRCVLWLCSRGNGSDIGRQARVCRSMGFAPPTLGSRCTPLANPPPPT